ncbi:protein of unknown function [Candidatus Methylocalor cossyra]|uniref:Uncharacterized protein n=1 Tax=Candidatus Methylocalor cossyra TaxID=3108543 RepID=A0ABP1C3V1_9GAMM
MGGVRYKNHRKKQAVGRLPNGNRGPRGPVTGQEPRAPAWCWGGGDGLDAETDPRSRLGPAPLRWDGSTVVRSVRTGGRCLGGGDDVAG